MDPTTAAVVVTGLLLGSVVALRATSTLNAPKRDELAQERALLRKTKREIEELHSDVKSEKGRLLATLRNAARAREQIQDQDDDLDDLDVDAGIERYLDHPLAGVFAKAHDIDLQKVKSGDDEEWQKVRKLIRDKTNGESGSEQSGKPAVEVI